MQHARPLAFLVVLASACSDVPPAAPELASVSPAVTRSLTAVTLTIAGRNLLPRQAVDFNHPDGSHGVGELALSLVAEGGAPIPLELLTHPNPTQLTARLPANTAPGLYALLLTDGWNRTAQLPAALRVLRPCENETGPKVGDACDGPDSDLCPDDVYGCSGTTLICSTGADELELCDGLDNDCDPSTADGAAEPTLGQACDGDDGDLCTDDRRVCAGALGMSCSSGATNPELCDGLDNDCDPTTADGSGEATLGQGCDGTDTDLCTDDAWICAGASGLVCSAGTNNPEPCDGVDNDCTPATADGATEPTLAQPCDGDDTDLCTDDAWVCSGAAGMTCTSGGPNPEICDGVDNDCRATTADGSSEADFGLPCDGADSDLCNDDTWVCSGAGGMTCPTGAANPELCDGIDNDCRGTTADGSGEANFGQPCDSTADADTCLDGTWVCNGIGPGLTCNDGPTTVGCVSVDVGSFTQQPNATTRQQTVAHALGSAPKLLLVWSSGNLGVGPGTSYYATIGAVDETRAARAHASAREGTSTAAGRYVANAAVAVTSNTGGLLASATVPAWSATSFTLQWDTTSTSARVFQFLAVSGSSVRSALRGWTMPLGASTVSQTGLGFAPVATLHLTSGYSFTATPSAGAATGQHGIAATDGTSEWVALEKALDGLLPTQTSRAMRNDACMFGWEPSFAVGMVGSCAGGLGADGFSVAFSDPPPQAGIVSTLAMAGVLAKTGCFAKSTSTAVPFTQAVTGVGFTPLAVFLASDNAQLGAAALDLASYSYGASTGAEDFASGFIDADADGTSANAKSFSSNAAAYLRFDTTGATLTSAEVSSLDANGFTLRYTANTATAADLCYLAIGAP